MKNIALNFACGALSAAREAFALLSGTGECVVCGARCGASGVCRECAVRFFSVPRKISTEGRCAVCGRILAGERGTCMECRAGRALFHTDSVLPVFSYRLWNRELVSRWKTEGERAMAAFLARLAEQALRAAGFGRVIVPVPPRKNKLREKGWDQIRDICFFLRARGFEIFDALVRRSSSQQKSLGKEERLGSISLAYAAKSGRALSKALRASGGALPDRVCVIDDVMTTGATLESCAIALKGLGVKRVDALTLFAV